MQRPLSQSIGSSIGRSGAALRRELFRSELRQKMEANAAGVLVASLPHIRDDWTEAHTLAAALVEAAGHRRRTGDLALDMAVSKALDGLGRLARWHGDFQQAPAKRPGYGTYAKACRDIEQRMARLTDVKEADSPDEARVLRLTSPERRVVSPAVLAELSALSYVLPPFRQTIRPDYPLLDHVLDGIVSELDADSVNVPLLVRAGEQLALPQTLNGVPAKHRAAWRSMRGAVVTAARWAENASGQEVPLSVRDSLASMVDRRISAYREATSSPSLRALDSL